MIDVYLDNMNLSRRDQQLIENYLIPGYYLKQSAARQRDIDAKKDMFKKARELLSIMGISDQCSIKNTVLITVSPISVIPAKAGIQTQESSIPAGNLDSGFRRNDVKMFNKHHAANWTKR